MRLAALLPSVLLLAGCGGLPFGLGSAPQARSGPEGLAFTVQPGAAAAGGSAVLTLHNRSDEPVGYNLCVGALERLGGGLWVPALSSANGCPDTLATLAPGEQASAEALLPTGLETGDYRFVTQVMAPVGSWPETQLRSDEFAVRELGAE